MSHDFDRTIDRVGTGSLKWSFREEMCGNPEAIPMWVADMDFACPPAVVEAVAERAKHPIYGYSMRTDGYYEALISWMQRRNGWTIEKDWVCFSPGVVPSLNIAVLAYTDPGDTIIVQPPVYHPFFAAAAKNGRHLAENPLVVRDGRYLMDYRDLELKVEAGAKMLILSSPHNPAGRVWEKAELERLVEICARKDVVIVSDEIHSDLIMPGHRHVCLAGLGDEAARISVTCTAPNKTFNLAGIPTANIIIPNLALRERFAHQSAALGLGLANLFGIVALEAAYNHGEAWLDELNAYIHANYGILAGFVAEKQDFFSLAPMEGTYLAWLDCRKLGLSDAGLKDFFVTEAGLWLDEGSKFGTQGSGFMRINLACPARLLREALSKLDSALRRTCKIPRQDR